MAEVIILARELDRAEAEFDAFVDGLNEDEKANLVALMWIGRGSFEPEDWAEALITAYEEATTPTANTLRVSPIWRSSGKRAGCSGHLGHGRG